MKVKKYIWGNTPDLLPVDWDAEPSVSDNLVRRAGLEPSDHELGFGELVESWNGNRKGAIIISGCTCEGHPFAIVERGKNNDNE